MKTPEAKTYLLTTRNHHNFQNVLAIALNFSGGVKSKSVNQMFLKASIKQERYSEYPIITRFENKFVIFHFHAGNAQSNNSRRK